MISINIPENFWRFIELCDFKKHNFDGALVQHNVLKKGYSIEDIMIHEAHFNSLSHHLHQLYIRYNFGILEKKHINFLCEYIIAQGKESTLNHINESSHLFYYTNPSVIPTTIKKVFDFKNNEKKINPPKYYFEGTKHPEDKYHISSVSTELLEFLINYPLESKKLLLKEYNKRKKY